MRWLTFSLLFFMFSVTAAAQAQWTHQTSAAGDLPAPAGSTQQTACVVADFDLDGKDDFVVASRVGGGRVELWVGGPGAWAKHIIEPANVQPEAGGAAYDIDGDGDPDLVLGQDSSGNDIYWWENPYPAFGTPWTRRVIKNGGGTKHHDQLFGDVDGDGAVELVSWNQGAQELLLFEIPANPLSASSWSSTVIFNASSSQFEGLAIADVDGDGIDDIVGAGRWFRHQGGGVFSVEVIDAGAAFTRAAVGQLVPGGRPEIAFIPGDASGVGYWYQWDGSAWGAQVIQSFSNGHSLDLRDIDGDGHVDIFAGEMKLGSATCELLVYYGDSTGAFTLDVMDVGNGIHEGRLGDVDGDGDLDIIHKPYDDGTPRIDVWLNDGLTLDNWTTNLVDAAMPAKAIFIRHGDLDGDGDDDLAAGGYWYRNPGTLSGAWTQQPFGSPLNTVAVLHDFDGDGDLDAFGTQAVGIAPNADFAYAENLGGGIFSVHTNIISGTGDFLQGAVAGRLGGPASPIQIVLSWHAAGNGVQVVTVPDQPSTQTWTWGTLNPISQDEDLSLGDIDGDGDDDLLLGTVWLENPTWQDHVLGEVATLPGVNGTPLPDRNSLADIDGDGDLDAVIGLEDGTDLVWFENPLPGGAPTGLWTRYIFGNIAGQGFSMDVADFDGDGDPDVVVGEHRGLGQNRVMIFENDGSATGWPSYLVDSQSTSVIDHHDGTQAVDLDGDGDLDIASIGFYNEKVWVFENGAVNGTGTGPTGTPPVIAGAGVFRSFRRVQITADSPSAEIRYTLDGTVPVASSPLYTGPLTFGDDALLQAGIFTPGQDPSPTATAALARIQDEAHFWRFDHASALAKDDSAVPIDGVVMGATFVPGRAGLCLDFDGVSDRVDLGAFDVAGPGLSLVAWINPDSFAQLPSSDPRIISKATSVSEQDHVWMLSTIAQSGSVRLRFRLRIDGVTRTLIASSGDVPTGSWTNAAATYDGATMRIYQDGVIVGSLSVAGTPSTSPTTPVWIGDSPVGGNRPFDGRIDDVRIYDRALTSEEVSAIAVDVPPAGITSYGFSEPICPPSIRIEAVAPPEVVGGAFGVACAGAPPLQSGLLLFGSLADLAGTPFLGSPLWITATPSSFFLIPVASDQEGRHLLDIPLASVPPGLTEYAQYLWFQGPGCTGPQLLAVSDALEIVTF